MKKKYKIGIVGCGRISANHFNAIREFSNDLELVSVCDNNLKVLKKYKKKYSVPGYDDINQMIKSQDLDIISLCTPSGLHPKQTILAAKNKINVITEKPMAVRWQDGLKMVEVCKKFGVKLFVVKQNRYNSTLQNLKKAIENKRFGKIHLVQVNVFWCRPQSYYNQGNGWRGTKKLDGGALMNQASHYVDLLTWLVGPINKVQSMVSTYRKIEVEDTCVLNLKWLSGALGSMSVTMLTYPKNLEGSITIIGSKGTVKIGGVAVNEIVEWIFKDKKDLDRYVKQKSSYKTNSVYGYGHIQYYQSIVNVLKKKKKPHIDGNEGLKSLELIIASYISAKKNNTVNLPLKKKN